MEYNLNFRKCYFKKYIAVIIFMTMTLMFLCPHKAGCDDQGLEARISRVENGILGAVQIEGRPMDNAVGFMQVYRRRTALFIRRLESGDIQRDDGNHAHSREKWMGSGADATALRKWILNSLLKQGGRLIIIREGRRSELIPTNKDVFYYLDDGFAIQFKRDEAGEVKEVVIPGGRKAVRIR